MRSSVLPLVVLAALAAAGVGYLFLGSDTTSGTRPAPMTAPSAGAPAAKAPEDLVPLEAVGEDAPQEPSPQRTEVGSTADGGERYGEWGAGEVELVGRVKIPAGVPADDELWILALAREVSPSRLYGESALFDPNRRPRAGEPVISAARVGADGRFRLAFPADRDEGWLAVGGRFLYSKKLLRVELPAPAEILVEPQAGACLTVDVTLPDGLAEPEAVLEGLEVVLGPDSTQFSMLNLEADWMFQRSATPEGQARFVLRGVNAERPLELEVHSEPLADLVVESLRLEPGRERHLQLRLLRGARVHGRVVDEDGRGVEDALVSALRTALWGMPGGTVAETRSGADGSFDLTAIPPGEVHLTAEKEGLLESSPESVELADEEVVAGVELVLERGNHVAGVLRYPDGRPRPNTVVKLGFDPAAMAGMSAFNMARGADGRARTDAEGRFRVTGLGRGPFLLTALVEDEETGETWSARKAGVSPNSEDVELVLALRPGFEGRVVDGNGEPITRFQVHASARGAVLWVPGEKRDEAFQDDQGRFRLEALEPGTWEFRVDAEGYGTSQAAEVALPLDPGAEPRTFVLHEAGSAAGRVVDSSGQGVAGALVTLSVPSDEVFARMTGELELPETYADEDGAFLLAGLTPGPVSLLARHPDHAESPPVSLEVVSGETTANVVLTLRSGGVLSGEVYDKEGEAAAGAQLFVQDTANWSTEMARVDADGTFRLTKLRPGKWQVTAMLGAIDPGSGEDDAPDMENFMENMRFTVVEVKEGEETHVVLGAPPEDPVHVHGKVTHAGEPVTGAMVSFLPEDGEGFGAMKFTQLDERGEYALDLDAPGAYLVQVQTNGQATGFAQNNLEFPRTIPAGDDHRLDLELPVARIAGRVTDRDGDPIAGARVTLTTDGGVNYGTFMGGQYAEATTADDGSYAFDYVRPGTYSVAAGGSMFGGAFGSHSDYGRVLREGIEVAEGDAVEGVDFRLERAGELTGQVLDPGGRPLAGAAIFVRDGAGRLLERFSMITSGPDGSFRYTGVAPGRYSVQARTSELVSGEMSEVEVREGEPARTTLTLQPGTLLLISISDTSGDQVRARVSVKDSRGREVNGMLAYGDIMNGSGGFSSDEQRVGPVPPGRYVVEAVAPDGRKVRKPVVLNGQSKRRVRLRLR